MKKILLGTTMIAGLMAAGTAQAADLKAPAYKAPQAPYYYNWSGFYIGLNAGGSWGHSAADYVLGGIPITSFGLHPKGFIGGGQIGYRWQSGAFVFGLEADAAWRNARDSATFAFANGIDFTDIRTEQRWLGTARPVLGVASNNWLFYATGGLAFGGIEHSVTERRPITAGAFRTFGQDDTQTGWTVGGGVKTGFAQWTFGVEYLFVDFGRSTVSAPAQTIVINFPTSQVSFKDTSNIVRAKVDYRF
jgi:outer membrane immunogenic protein